MNRTLLVLLSLALLLPGAALAAPSDQIKDATVNIYCTYKKGSKLYSTTGSGVFVESRGIILTNAHVALPLLLEDKKGKSLASCSIRTGSPAKELYPVKLLYMSPKWIDENMDALKEKRLRGSGAYDAALLYVDAPRLGMRPLTFTALPIAATTLGLVEGAQVTAAGYPAEGKSFKQVRSKLTQVTADATVTATRTFTRPHTDVIVLSESKAGASGVSGGPVVSTDGQLAALTTAVEDSGSKKSKERSIRAITLPYISRFVSEETGMPLSVVLLGSISDLALRTDSSLTPELRKELSTTYLKRK